ncbi:hypothetical protein WMF04_22225 [Sorangium sp. So ce260]|uniref:hypothetical protein n=1 Tax=Sorangium sp. So ce260 TaxID=3133291 RepID=UPI003F6204DF
MVENAAFSGVSGSAGQVDGGELGSAPAWSAAAFYLEEMIRTLLSAFEPLSPEEDAAHRVVMQHEAVDSLRERIERYGGFHLDPSYQAFLAGALSAQQQANDRDAARSSPLQPR